MRLHRNTAEAIVKGLHDIHCEENLAGYIVPRLLKSNKKWGSRDRNAVAETIYDITRYWRYYAFIASTAASCNEAAIWKMLGTYLLEKGGDLPEWEEFAGIELKEELVAEAKSQFVIGESIPDWFDELGRKALGDSVWEAEIVAMNQPAEVVLRVNPLAVPKAQKGRAKLFVQQELLKQDIATEILENYPDALQLQRRRSIQHTKAFQNGWVEIQDANSQAVAPFCEAKEDDLVIDTCAGAGGKSLHLAALVGNEADIFSLDVVPHKIAELERRAKRAKTLCIESGTVVEFPFEDFAGRADVVLIDAPCSGTGTLKRDADKKWKLTPEFLEEIVTVQQQILQDYAKLTKVGGTLVYATCSILPSENQEQVQQFLATELGSQFELEKDNMLFAHQTGYDGFYMARLRRL